eukprot:CAMPEP_0175057632 /NCGR_PEP_ID=MMETSP0052_2-20121109/11369_1 /TAXON_ID=51329 ORGANISM="Polytomella parva, Strain SAG 63-3" /NCGR_SAMPLE_ID=MMETSP0052_2 /ASSEMBLY_ACC=CAM_ASM_000194 /LENGTH=852 /DNA_ID=CAMNT_0016322861 /DNA_START=448 /DNA_END=3002 /DNA_ORIENTATION=-
MESGAPGIKQTALAVAAAAALISMFSAMSPPQVVTVPSEEVSDKAVEDQQTSLPLKLAISDNNRAAEDPLNAGLNQRNDAFEMLSNDEKSGAGVDSGDNDGDKGGQWGSSYSVSNGKSSHTNNNASKAPYRDPDPLLSQAKARTLFPKGVLRESRDTLGAGDAGVSDLLSDPPFDPRSDPPSEMSLEAKKQYGARTEGKRNKEAAKGQAKEEEVKTKGEEEGKEQDDEEEEEEEEEEVEEEEKEKEQEKEKEKEQDGHKVNPLANENQLSENGFFPDETSLANEEATLSEKDADAEPWVSNALRLELAAAGELLSMEASARATAETQAMSLVAQVDALRSALEVERHAAGQAAELTAEELAKTRREATIQITHLEQQLQHWRMKGEIYDTNNSNNSGGSSIMNSNRNNSSINNNNIRNSNNIRNVNNHAEVSSSSDPHDSPPSFSSSSSPSNSTLHHLLVLSPPFSVLPHIPPDIIHQVHQHLHQQFQQVHQHQLQQLRDALGRDRAGAVQAAVREERTRASTAEREVRLALEKRVEAVQTERDDAMKECKRLREDWEIEREEWSRKRRGDSEEREKQTREIEQTMALNRRQLEAAEALLLSEREEKEDLVEELHTLRSTAAEAGLALENEKQAVSQIQKQMAEAKAAASHLLAVAEQRESSARRSLAAAAADLDMLRQVKDEAEHRAVSAASMASALRLQLREMEVTRDNALSTARRLEEQHAEEMAAAAAAAGLAAAAAETRERELVAALSMRDEALRLLRKEKVKGEKEAEASLMAARAEAEAAQVAAANVTQELLDEQRSHARCKAALEDLKMQLDRWVAQGEGVKVEAEKAVVDLTSQLEQALRLRG